MPSSSMSVWRKSSRSVADGNCVEIAALSDGRIAIRDSKTPDTGVLQFTHTDITAWIASLENK